MESFTADELTVSRETVVAAIKRMLIGTTLSQSNYKDIMSATAMCVDMSTMDFKGADWSQPLPVELPVGDAFIASNISSFRYLTPEEITLAEVEKSYDYMVGKKHEALLRKLIELDSSFLALPANYSLSKFECDFQTRRQKANIRIIATGDTKEDCISEVIKHLLEALVVM